MCIDIADLQRRGCWQEFFLQAICFAYSSFYKITIDSALEISLGDRDQNLVVRHRRIGVRHKQHLEREQIKRGTLVEEFLYMFFLTESFFLTERKFPHRDQNIQSLSGKLNYLKGIIYALRSSRQKQ